MYSTKLIKKQNDIVREFFFPTVTFSSLVIGYICHHFMQNCFLIDLTNGTYSEKSYTNKYELY